MTTLIIARHGNTFGLGDKVTYVGARTDLPLVEFGKLQAASIGHYLKQNRLIPDVVYSSALKRARETAKIAVKESGISNPVFELDIFNEIDYGPDENKTRQEIIARIGEQALKDWDEKSIPPKDWNIDIAAIIKNWQDFVEQAHGHDDNETILVVTSNGIARFAPYICGDDVAFGKINTAKLATGALGILKYENSGWAVKEWNIKP